ncbi:MBL fold metallo-hydrolase [Deminuibacter soli]|uniref:3',5'-cyclic-nucleotide phosphodiesterase n=1 Tax=Deminuibacter soli TaxID=2291815 RepID=A0A3E1NEX3_9BACT|nr:3',5'-cyclic-nucleotide phosphodiesterase [Deminuibacter soli]RFM26351.1 3',5'-cyclic-nucleotide phosphodiesterase [Deminuibacter soli]
MHRIVIPFLTAMLFFVSAARAQQVNYAFSVVPLGVKGGMDESNLSAYMLAPAGSNNYVCLDAGTLRAGIDKAVQAGVFTVPTGNVLRQYIKGYLISHGHLDHLAGMIINSPDDTAKNIYGMRYCLDILKDKYFTWTSWANFANEGEKPAIGKYHYVTLEEGEEQPLANTDMLVQAFPLSHVNPYQSTAFLVRKDSNYILYLGDTGADSAENSDKLQLLWNKVAPLVADGRLKAIMIEVSFPDEQPVKQLFGHLTPRLLMQELSRLQAIAGTSLRNFPVVITHIKPSGAQETAIHNELQQQNATGVKLVFPKQGTRLRF